LKTFGRRFAMNKKISRKFDAGPFPRRWLKVSEAALYLNQNIKSFYRCLAKRQIPYSRVRGVGIRIDRIELDRILERNQISAR
jgi:excisionase family DNA binding protein